MADLIEKFFQSELTEAEDKALAKRLDSSEDAAARFADRAEQAYFSFGLPEPKAPGSLGNLGKVLRSSLGRILPVMGLLGGMSVLYWLMKPENPPVSPVISPARAEPSPLETGITKAKPALPVRQVLRKISPVPDLGAAPPNPGFETDYRNLKVMVDQEKEGPITVRILSPDGFEIRRLYEGPLGEGKWSFSWDGILADGLPADPGVYHIEVQGGATVISKEVIVH